MLRGIYKDLEEKKKVPGFVFTFLLFNSNPTFGEDEENLVPCPSSHRADPALQIIVSWAAVQNQKVGQ